MARKVFKRKELARKFSKSAVNEPGGEKRLQTQGLLEYKAGCRLEQLRGGEKGTIGGEKAGSTTGE